MRLSSIGSGLVVLGIVVATACSGTGNNTSAGTSTSSGSGVGGGGSGGGTGASCTPACAAPQFCSSAATCLDPGKCAGDGDCAAGTICDTAMGQCVPGGGCAGEVILADPIPPNLLVVLDRSCSMTDVVTAKQTKWDIAVGALNKLTTTYAKKVRFGMTLFPDLTGQACAQDAIPIPVGPGNEMAIQTLLTASLVNADKYFPKGPCVTNIDTAMQQAQGEPAFNDMNRDSYALLLTDGAQSACNLAGSDNGTTAIIKALATKKVPTFVIGFGTGVDAKQMNIFADAGGVPSGDPMTHYYKAEDQMSLDTALGLIAKKTLSCSFKLASKPSDPSKIFVFFNKDPKSIPQDPAHMMGWDYDAATDKLTFYGMDCAGLKGGTVKSVDIVVGCDMLPPH